LELIQKQPIDEPYHREAALNALLFLHEVAKAAHDTPAAIAALEEAGALIDKETNPLLWADIYEPLAEFLLEHAKLDRAGELINDIIDIREECQGESHADLAGTLLLWANLLHKRANYAGMESVAAGPGASMLARIGPTSLFSKRSEFSCHSFATAKPIRRCRVPLPPSPGDPGKSPRSRTPRCGH